MARVAGLGHVGIYVRDLERMVAFYRDFLGMQITKQNWDRGMVFLSSDPVASDHEIALMRGRPDDDNPATDDKGSNQWFFNLVNNEANLGSQNGGFTEFGEVINAGGLAVMDAIAAFPTVNGGGVFSNLAVQNNTIDVNEAAADPQGTLVTIRRIALRNTVVAWPT